MSCPRPESFLVRLRPLLTALTVTLALTITSTLVATAPAGASTTRATRMVALINAERAGAGLAPLARAQDLSATARAHSREMAAAQALFHRASFASVCCWSAVAENVGTGFSVTSLHGMLMNSPSHRANIMNPAMTQVGIGYVRTGNRLWVTQVFRRPR